MESKVFKQYNEMGDGYFIIAIIYDYHSMSKKIIHVGRFADVDTPSSTYVRRDDKDGNS